MNTQPLTDTQLDEIAGRAAGLHEYATGLDDAWQDEADQLAGTDVPALLDEIRRLRTQLAATHTKVIATEADEIVAYCPDHGSRDSAWITCHCDVADDMRRRAAGADAEETHVVADDSDDPEHIDDCPGCPAV